MAELSGALGIQALSAARQSERSRGASFDSGLARKPTKPPARLSRVLYIPVHSSSELHVSIHDVSAGYKHVIGHAPMGGSEIIGDAVMGSRLFMTRLGTMNKPTAGAEGSKVQYAFDAVVGDTEASATLQRCPPGNAEQAVKMLVFRNSQFGREQLIRGIALCHTQLTTLNSLRTSRWMQ